MPADFERCVAQGGKVRTVDLGGDKYVHYCFIGGKSHRGEVQSKKRSSSKKVRDSSKG